MTATDDAVFDNAISQAIVHVLGIAGVFVPLDSRYAIAAEARKALAEVHQGYIAVRAPRVITGTVQAVMGELDQLPIGSIVTCDDGTQEGLVYHRIVTAGGNRRWATNGFGYCSSELIARHEVPIEVLR